MTDRLVERAGSFASQIGTIARRGLAEAGRFVVRAQREAQTRAIASATARQAEAAAVEAAARRFGPMLDAALAAYEPKITQADLNAVTWSHPEPSAAVLRGEIDRIIGVLAPLLREAGFPLSTKDKALRAHMTKVWVEAQGALQRKAFGRLKLPVYFHAPDGVLDYEPVVRRKDYFGYEALFGAWSGYRYPYRPVLTP